MVKLVNRAKMSTATTGTGTITLGSAVDGFQTFAAAGVANGDTVRYAIEDGNNWEIGTGTYNVSGPTMTRTVSESSNSDLAINLSGTALVFLTVAGEDIVPADGGTFTGPLAIEGKISAGDELHNANLINTLDYSAAGGVAGYRPINLIDSLAGIKISRPNDDDNGAFIEFQEWDSTITTLKSRAMIVGESGDLLYRNLTTGGGNHIFQGEANAELMRIDSAGNVGIGTSSPVQLLHLAKAGIAGMRIEDLDAAGGYTDLEQNGSAFFIDAHDEDGTEGIVLFRTAGSETVRIDSSGNVGIGTSSPQARLHVANAQGGQIGRILFDANVASGYETRIDATDVGLEFTAKSNSRGFAFNTGSTPTERMRIDSSGNVGIGTSSPDTLFTVKGQTVIGDLVAESANLTNLLSGTPPQLVAGWSVPAITWTPSTVTEAVFTRSGNMSITILSDNTSNARINFADEDSETAGVIDYDHADNSLAIDVNGSEAMRIDSNGNVLIGTTTGDYAFAIKDSGVDIALINQNDTVWTIGQNVVVNEFTIRDVTAGQNRLHIDGSGNVGIGTTTPGSKLSVVGLPTSSAGLSAGDIWNDGGTLKIV